MEVKEYTYTSPDVPAAFDGTRIVLLTDIHRSFFFSQERLAGIVDQVERACDADLVVLGGDYVYGSKDYEAIRFRGTRPARGAARGLRRARQPRLRPPWRTT